MQFMYLIQTQHSMSTHTQAQQARHTIYMFYIHICKRSNNYQVHVSYKTSAQKGLSMASLLRTTKTILASYRRTFITCTLTPNSYYQYFVLQLPNKLRFHKILACSDKRSNSTKTTQVYTAVLGTLSITVHNRLCFIIVKYPLYTQLLRCMTTYRHH